jgi:fimbrial chaperone protein
MMRWPNSAIPRFASLLALVLSASLAHGGGTLRVNPVRVNLSPLNSTAAVTLENGGSSSMVLQLQLMHWSAAGGEERYDASDDILATPPIMTIAPGKSQLVRVGLSRPADPKRELAYRLFIEEVPPPPKPGYQGLQVALRVGLPIFIEPAAIAEPVLQWRATRGGANTIAVDVVNAGDAHTRVFNVRLRAPGEDRLLGARQVASYLLPGQSQRWMVESEGILPADRIRVSADTDRGVLDADVELANP